MLCHLDEDEVGRLTYSLATVVDTLMVIRSGREPVAEDMEMSSVYTIQGDFEGLSRVPASRQVGHTLEVAH